MLTPEEIYETLIEVAGVDVKRLPGGWRQFAEAIERKVLADSSDAYVRGWNACCDTFNVGAHIAAVKPKPDVN
jgi:hypothetical protein